MHERRASMRDGDLLCCKHRVSSHSQMVRYGLRKRVDALN